MDNSNDTALQQLEFRVDIEAPAEKVWRTLWEDATYRKWTSVFSEGSYAVSDWKEGSKIQFLSPSGSGLYSRIRKMIPNEVISFEHLGEIKGGVEQASDAASAAWAGAQENYYLETHAGTTALRVTIEVTEESSAYFYDHFPLALQKVKALSEQN